MERRENKTRSCGVECLEETSIVQHGEGNHAPLKTEGVAINTETTEVSAADLGWRFAIGTGLIFGGYIGWTLIPLVIAADLEPSVKAGLTGLFGATPFMTKVIAVALMGRPAYRFLKRSVTGFVRRRSGQESSS